MQQKSQTCQIIFNLKYLLISQEFVSKRFESSSRSKHNDLNSFTHFVDRRCQSYFKNSLKNYRKITFCNTVSLTVGRFKNNLKCFTNALDYSGNMTETIRSFLIKNQVQRYLNLILLYFLKYFPLFLRHFLNRISFPCSNEGYFCHAEFFVRFPVVGYVPHT